jgi:ATP-dependent DNA ligase
MEINLGTDSILQIFHPDALKQFKLTSDLEYVCSTLKKGKRSLNSDLLLFVPCEPMHLEKCTPNDAFQCKAYWVQEKLDGYRMFIHKSPTQIKYFSRNRIDYSTEYSYLDSIFFSLLSCCDS